MKQYKALKPIGRWQKGDIVGDLTTDQIKQLIAERTIEEVPIAEKKTVKAGAK